MLPVTSAGSGAPTLGDATEISSSAFDEIDSETDTDQEVIDKIRRRRIRKKRKVNCHELNSEVRDKLMHIAVKVRTPGLQALTLQLPT